MLKQRVLAALVLIPLFLAALFYLPQWAWALLMGIVVLLAADEWARLAGFRPGLRYGYLSLTALCLLGCYRLLETGSPLAWGLTGVAVAFWLVVAPLWLARGWRVTAALPRALLGWLLLLPTWIAMLELRLIGPGLVLFVMGLVWLADSAAYFSGRLWGRHKLAPRVSPGKTWEGVAGALVAVAVFALFVAATAPNALLAGNSVPAPALMIAACFIAVVSVIGDLFESHMKRLAGVKDSGQLIPGHGGVLDRIDSQTAALPLFLLLALAWLDRLGG